MRVLIAALLATTALPAFADTIAATSRITAVTVYPDGAKLTREVTFTAPSAGSHELLVTDLPYDSDPGMIRLATSEGLQTGAFNLRADRLPPREDPLTEDQKAAKAAVEAAEAAADQAQLALEAVTAKVEAAEAQVRFLSSFSGALPDGATPETIKAMAGMIGAETLAARQTALAAKAELPPAQKAVTEAQEALAKAQAGYDALPSADMDYTALSVAVKAAEAGEETVTITQYVGNASWQPVYDLNLTRKDGDKLVVNRSVLVTQYTGEDWDGVALTLSSSRPSEQAAPSQLWPELRSIAPEAKEEDLARKGFGDGAVMYESAPMAEPVTAAITAGMAYEGDTVVYQYPELVNVATGAENLRLALDSLDFAPVVKAVAVPRLDKTAFVMASFTNASEEPLLPGQAMLFREGVLVGSTWLDVIAPGVETDVGFGAIETVTVKREMPKRAGGETGVFVSANQQTESAVITVENTGTESWPVRILDQVPFSEQDDLEIEVSASPAPTETDVEGQRGILAWEFDLAAGGKQTITLEHVLTWPDGMILQ
ncbi:MAG: mucoidy inhibitor MuiA family protein [Tabrizicola sp.]